MLNYNLTPVLVFILPLFLVVVSSSLLSAIGITSDIPVIILLMLYGAYLLKLGIKLNKPNQFKFLAKELNQEGEYSYTFGKHSIFCFKMEYWGIFIVGCSIYAFIIKIKHL